MTDTTGTDIDKVADEVADKVEAPVEAAADATAAAENAVEEAVDEAVKSSENDVTPSDEDELFNRVMERVRAETKDVGSEAEKTVDHPAEEATETVEDADPVLPASDEPPAADDPPRSEHWWYKKRRLGKRQI